MSHSKSRVVVALLAGAFLATGLTGLAMQQTQRVRVGSDVAQANLVKQVRPEYPAEARAARVQDTVTLEVVISREGRVAELTVVSGHALLRQSARDAVAQWEYKPFQLNGQQIEVATTITVNYSFQ
jgi:protein TonB